MKFFFYLIFAGMTKFYEKYYLDALKRRHIKKFKNYGVGSRINGVVGKITGHDNIVIGNNVHLGNNAFIVGDGGLEIGDNTHISRNLVLYSQNHNYEGDLLPYDSSYIKKPVIISKNVWIGMNVIILPGTRIGEGCVIGAGAVLYGDVPPLSVVSAGSWSIIKQRDESHYHELDKKEAYGSISGRPIEIS